ncbi:MAG: OsmC family protein, partial [Gemmatimonadota bacterium]
MSIEHRSIVATRQAPLRDRYPDHPAEAIAVKRVRSLAGPSTDPLHGRVEPIGVDGTPWDFGLDAKVGGYDDLPNPGHLLCAALAACLDSTLRMLADRLGIGLRRVQVDVVGHVDVRGCLALADDVRPGFERITCAVEMETAPTADPRRTAIMRQQAERLCVTLDTL